MKTKPEGATTQPTLIDCPLCAPNPCIGGAHRNAMVEDGVITLSEVQIHEAENADCEGCNREDCKACAYNEAHPPPDFVTKAGTKIFIPSAQPVPSAGSKPQPSAIEMAVSGAVIRRMQNGEVYFIDWGNVHFGTTLQGMSNLGHDLTLYADREKRGKQ